MKAVILAGGTGSRLWPKSRDNQPKQFQAFVGDKTMLQQTYERLSFLKPGDIFVATNEVYRALVKKQLPKLAAKNLIIEPAMRDTAPCICHAAHHLAKLGFAKEVMAIIYADHLIQKSAEFKKALLSAVRHIEEYDALGVIAVRAKYANPNLGYIRIGAPRGETPEGLSIYELDRFVEKPTMEVAKTFLHSYKYLWNTGLYLWKVGTILEEFKLHTPAVYNAIVKNECYEDAPKISIDYAVIEKVAPERIHVFPAELGWNDVGNWAALHEELTARESDNLCSGETLAMNTRGSVIFGQGGKSGGRGEKLVVAYGLKDIVIVDTPEALLVMPKDKAAEVKAIVERIKKEKRWKYL